MEDYKALYDGNQTVSFDDNKDHRKILVTSEKGAKTISIRAISTTIFPDRMLQREKAYLRFANKLSSPNQLEKIG